MAPATPAQKAAATAADAAAKAANIAAKVSEGAAATARAAVAAVAPNTVCRASAQAISASTGDFSRHGFVVGSLPSLAGPSDEEVFSDDWSLPDLRSGFPRGF
ncbi:hypothetical protein EYF80_063319 [Liparis tanakae]|uniref:Uncharacterized protein n=1 Tax=Liparis tanakae TaxID=230148 RepID=A0A4Z2ECT6_9TELE|nr:hypothetical protein EYF80_063319 [Liparis tanakae]